MRFKLKTRILLGICGSLMVMIMSCQSYNEIYKREIIIALEQYEKITKDYDSYMRQMQKDYPGQITPESSLNSAKNTCLRLDKTDVSKTPQEFQVLFKKRISIECGNLSNPSDQVTYKDDPKTEALKKVVKEIKQISLKYGYEYSSS
jgi:hypothetical protein